MSLVVDKNNNLHCIGWGVYNNNIYALYFKYNYDENWSDWAPIGYPTNLGAVGGADIDINSQNLPAIAYRQKTYDIGPYNDSTMYTFFDGNQWSVPELVVNDPYEQKIAIDKYNRVHIIDREKSETGYKLVHYRKINGLWQGDIIDEANFYIVLYDLLNTGNSLWVAYYKTDIEGEGDVFISKYDITTGNITQKRDAIKGFNIYPNPFRNSTTIDWETGKDSSVEITVCELNGKPVKTLEKGKFVSGRYRTIWNGKSLNGKEVEAGVYLVRLKSGRNIVTKPVEFVK